MSSLHASVSSSSGSHKVWAVVPAAGVGSRMGAEFPKQYLPLCGKTILEQTLAKLSQLPQLEGIVVVVDSNDDRWKEIDTTGYPNLFSTWGGTSRAESVVKGLNFIVHHVGRKAAENVRVLVHDAARPCVNVANIQKLVTQCDELGTGGILAAPVADTVKKQGSLPAVNLAVKSQTEGGSQSSPTVQQTVDRTPLWLAHTPQYFPLLQLTEALLSCASKELEVTDEASAIEQWGGDVLLVADGKDNIKVTLPEDLLVAEAILKNQLGK